jgi:glycerophosphoryl diester phosphodiesterase
VPPELIAHRGASRECRENTLPAFARALELGADGIELDVHASSDGVIVVHHDFVPRAEPPTPKLAGRPIAELTARELRSKSFTPKSSSSFFTDLLTAAVVTPSVAAARLKLRSSAVRTKGSTPVKRSARAWVISTTG